MRLRVVSPCPVSWDDLRSSGPEADKARGRYCEACNLHVIDLASMPIECAIDLVRAKKAAGERVCGRLPRPEPRRPLLAAAAAAAVALAGCTAEVVDGPGPEPVPAAAPAPAPAVEPACDPETEPSCKSTRVHDLGDVMVTE